MARATTAIEFTDAQAGGRIERGCIDHMYTLNAIVRERTKQNKPTFIAFLDVEKAYDRVWKDSMFDALWRNGLKGKLWRVMYNLNSKLKASVKTKFGNTRVFDVTEGIRQGGPLSGLEFGATMDQGERHLQNKGVTIQSHDLQIASLLLQDDIAIIADSPEKLQQALDEIFIFACQYRLIFNTEKCKIIVFNYNGTQRFSWSLGGTIIEITTEHKWLGFVLNPNLSLTHHSNNKEHQIQGILQSCLATINDDILNRMKMKTLLKLHQQSLVPSIIYGLQAWNITENEMCALEAIQYTILRKILKSPKSTPKLSLLADTGLLKLEYKIHCAKLGYYKALLSKQTHVAAKILAKQAQMTNVDSDTFYYEIETLLSKYNLPRDPDTIRLMSKNRWKNLTKKAVLQHANQNYLAERAGKYKQRLVNPYKNQIKLESYITDLKRTQAIAIFKLRYGMTYLKANFSSNFSNQNCLKCDLGQVDDENHILVCPARATERKIFNIGNFNPAFKLDTNLFGLSVIAEFLICSELVSIF